MDIVIILVIAVIVLVRENAKINKYPAIKDWQKYTIDQLELPRDKLIKNHKEGQYS